MQDNDWYDLTINLKHFDQIHVGKLVESSIIKLQFDEKKKLHLN